MGYYLSKEHMLRVSYRGRCRSLVLLEQRKFRVAEIDTRVYDWLLSRSYYEQHINPQLYANMAR
jgi:phosphorylcholine metabolism protein LicD